VLADNVDDLVGKAVRLLGPTWSGEKVARTFRGPNLGYSRVMCVEKLTFVEFP